MLLLQLAHFYQSDHVCQLCESAVRQIAFFGAIFKHLKTDQVANRQARDKHKETKLRGKGVLGFPQVAEMIEIDTLLAIDEWSAGIEAATWTQRQVRRSAYIYILSCKVAMALKMHHFTKTGSGQT
jgi:hypothetical protein